MEKIKVIYIAGEGRSGSTLLERILGQHPQIFAAGELIHIWERSFLENQLCSCGKPFKECLIWKQITNIFLKKQPNFNPKKVSEILKKISRIRHYFLNKHLRQPYVTYINNIYTDLYKSILEGTNKTWIIDSSKHPVFAHILSQNKNIDLYIIHLIRDIRGVAYSWAKKKIRPEIPNKKEYMPRYSILRTAASWVIVNQIALDLKKNPNIKYKQIFYEEFISNLENIIKDIFSFLNLKFENNNFFLQENTLLLKQNHTISGNPFRFKVGEIKISPDLEWQDKLPIYKQFLLKLIAFPIEWKLRK